MNDQEHKCKCDFRIRMLGDGCRYCQPQEYIDRLHDTMDGMIHTDCFELTDEEIEECCCFLDVRLHHRYEPNAVVKDIEWTVTGIKDFVEAILKKANEND